MPERDYSQAPLWKKLGVVEGARVRVIGRPKSVGELADLTAFAKSGRSDLDFETVQEIGLKCGLVDNKICRVDDDWQAVRFVRRLQK